MSITFYRVRPGQAPNSRERRGFVFRNADCLGMPCWMPVAFRPKAKDYDTTRIFGKTTLRDQPMVRICGNYLKGCPDLCRSKELAAQRIADGWLSKKMP